MLNHIALSCMLEENADRFYIELLGYEKLRHFDVPPELTEKIFGVNQKCKVVVYKANGFNLEVFIVQEEKSPERGYAHICIEVDDRIKFIEKCKQMGIATNIVPKGDRELLFIKDFDGNMFEIKEKAK